MEGPGSGGLTRKEMLKLSALGGAALVLPIQRVAQTQLSIDDRMPESQFAPTVLGAAAGSHRS